MILFLCSLLCPLQNKHKRLQSGDVYCKFCGLRLLLDGKGKDLELTCSYGAPVLRSLQRVLKHAPGLRDDACMTLDNVRPSS